uniref:SCP domain-containing protein n=1 Tax=Timema cristinae TaxID=61476 RepID=A0A7R9CYH9_TIMCR|nr:unnamed protein product [Timema cristinae]
MFSIHLATIYLIFGYLMHRVKCDTDYCSLCSPPGSHTMCLYPKPGPDPKCYNYGDMPLSKDEKDHILELHNKFRSSVAMGKEKPQPPAGNMRQMSWDKELETIAERWADRCNSYSTDTPHDKCRRSKRFQVGQNVATYGSSAKPFSPDSHARTMEWFKEIKYFKPEWINSYRQHHEIMEKTGHYAQFIWAESFLIGCARVIFEEMVDNSTYTFDRLVCNYGPSGNVEGSPVGGKRSEYHLYRPNENGNFECFTTGMEIDLSKINDDYCDCEEDGSDEPGTSACQNGRFHCNIQLSLESIPSHRVNDGICDCCDGSDEWAVKRLHFRLAGE